MLEWKIDDDEMRCELIRILDAQARAYRNPGDTYHIQTPEEAERRRAYMIRLAAHYQQAIDLLTAAPMPESEEAK
jgi:hypothetical protein